MCGMFALVLLIIALFFPDMDINIKVLIIAAACAAVADLRRGDNEQ